jgi:hypothetical protein
LTIVSMIESSVEPVGAPTMLSLVRTMVTPRSRSVWISAGERRHSVMRVVTSVFALAEAMSVELVPVVLLPLAPVAVLVSEVLPEPVVLPEEEPVVPAMLPEELVLGVVLDEPVARVESVEPVEPVVERVESVEPYVPVALPAALPEPLTPRDPLVPVELVSVELAGLLEVELWVLPLA